MRAFGMGKTGCEAGRELKGKPTTPQWKRFMSFVEKKDTGCWEWTGYLQTAGYGIMCVGTLGINLRRWLVHRLSWIIHHGALCSHVLVCHTCDNPKCVRPDHLFLGDHVANGQDAAQKHRMSYPRPWAAKLNPEAVSEIKRQLALGLSRRSIARQYGVRSQSIDCIADGRSWRHVS